MLGVEQLLDLIEVLQNVGFDLIHLILLFTFFKVVRICDYLDLVIALVDIINVYIVAAKLVIS